ncbi:hypothetical protein ACFW93_20965 [Streptomyces canus]|uniref:hypothetical protein n=1 Tax=Streptomyces canus TaxID=58343 RepID=UPI0036A1156F
MPVNSTKEYDPNAQLLASKLGGRAQAAFLNLKDYEFDAVSEEYVASAKPGNFQTGKAFPALPVPQRTLQGRTERDQAVRFATWNAGGD